VQRRQLAARSARPQDRRRRARQAAGEGGDRAHAFEQPAVELKPAELGVWVGTYREGVTGAVVSVTRAGDALALEGGGQTFALAPTSKRTFKLGPTPIVVELDGVAPRRKLAVRDRSFEEKYDEITLHALSSGELAGYAGRYRSDEANTEWTLAVKNAPWSRPVAASTMVSWWARSRTSSRSRRPA